MQGGEQHLLIPQLLAMPKVVKESFQNLDVDEQIADCHLHIIYRCHVYICFYYVFY